MFLIEKSVILVTRLTGKLISEIIAENPVLTMICSIVLKIDGRIFRQFVSQSFFLQSHQDETAQPSAPNLYTQVNLHCM